MPDRSEVPIKCRPFSPLIRPVPKARYCKPRPIIDFGRQSICGGAIAPFVAGKLGEHVSVQAPFYLGAGMTATGIGVLWTYRDALRPVGATVTALPLPSAPAISAIVEATPMVLAVGGATSRQVCALAAPLARARGAAVHVLHVIETDVLAGEDTADLESQTHARALLDACIAELSEAGVSVTGELLRSYGTHTDVAAAILHRATELGAGAIVLGPETRHATTTGVNAYIATHAAGHVIILNPDAGVLGRPSPDATDRAEVLAQPPAARSPAEPAGLRAADVG